MEIGGNEGVRIIEGKQIEEVFDIESIVGQQTHCFPFNMLKYAKYNWLYIPFHLQDKSVYKAFVADVLSSGVTVDELLHFDGKDKKLTAKLKRLYKQTCKRDKVCQNFNVSTMLLVSRPENANQCVMGLFDLQWNYTWKYLDQNLLNVVWDCGQEFKNLLADAEFNLVASRSAQAAVLKAVKAGETVVDLTNPTDGDGGDGGDNGGGSTPSTHSGGGSTGGGSSTRQYTISVTSANTEQGTVSGGGTYSEGSCVNISASAKSGYVFDKWSDGNTSATRTVNVSKNESFVAQFKVADSGSSDTGGEGDNETYI